MVPCFDYEYEVLGNHKNYNYDNIEFIINSIINNILATIYS